MRRRHVELHQQRVGILLTAAWGPGDIPGHGNPNYGELRTVVASRGDFCLAQPAVTPTNEWCKPFTGNELLEGSASS